MRVRSLDLGQMQPNQSLQQTLDPAAAPAFAESPSASSAAEPRRYAARDVQALTRSW